MAEKDAARQKILTCDPRTIGLSKQILHILPAYSAKSNGKKNFSLLKSCYVYEIVFSAL